MPEKLSFFFSISLIFSPVEIFLLMSRIRMQNFTIVDQGIPKIYFTEFFNRIKVTPSRMVKTT